MGRGQLGKCTWVLFDWWEGTDVRTNEKVAIKAIDMSQVDNEVVQFLLEMEKQALSIIDCPYVLQAIDIIQDNNHCFIVTEFCEGGTLQ